MKLHPALALAMVIGVDSGAMAQDRTPVQDAKLLLIAAIDAPSGQAQGVLVGEIADAITQRFRGMCRRSSAVALRRPSAGA